MKKIKIILAILLTLFFVYLFLWGGIQQVNLNQKGKFTVAYTFGSEIVSRGPLIKIKFNVSGTEYLAKKRSLKYNPIINGGRYFLKYLPSDPTTSEIYWDKPVPDSLQFIPPEGWTSIP